MIGVAINPNMEAATEGGVEGSDSWWGQHFHGSSGFLLPKGHGSIGTRAISILNMNPVSKYGSRLHKTWLCSHDRI